MDSEPKLFVISGPSGAGKGTLVKQLLKRVPSLTASVSATSRSRRPDEINGVDYHYLTEADFRRKIENGDFLEWAAVHGNYYGTPEKEVQSKLLNGRDVVLEIDIQGAEQVKRKRPECILIFITPPSMKELAGRLAKRGTEVPEDLSQRLTNAKKEIKLAKNYDYVVINDEVERATDELVNLVKKEKSRGGGRLS